MIDDLDGAIGIELRRITLPAAPEPLRARVRAIPLTGVGSRADVGERPGTDLRGRRRATTDRRRAWAWLAVAAVALVGVIGTVLALGGGGSHQLVAPSSAASAVPSGTPAAKASASLPTVVDGHPILTVSEVIRQRDAGLLGSGPLAIGGFWTYAAMPCNVPIPVLRSQPPPGDLEMTCREGAWGITERNEPLVRIVSHTFVRTGGPWLTPYFDRKLEGADSLALPFIYKQPYPPVPIVVVGHINDPRAADCQPTAIQLCKDRLVLDRIVEFDPSSVPPPPSPTPFPFADPPPAPFSADDCTKGEPVGFAGWTTLLSLGIERGDPEEILYVVITKNPVVISDWSSAKAPWRLWGRHVCYASEGDRGSMTFATLPGTEYREYRDGHQEPTSEP